MSDKPVRTRFAPSPTGPLHIGGVRSALFGWLIARHHDGQFVLRIEDTDRKRFVEGSIELIKEAFTWLGMDLDEGPEIGGDYGPYTQSERVELHQKCVNDLLENGHAYKCFCSSERLQRVNQEKQKRKEPPGYDRHCRNLSPEEVAQKESDGESFVVRLKMPLDGHTIADDLLRGKIDFDNATLQDIVLLKSDGFPTYHLAHVVDDHFMEISHVTRANEWIPSLPYHWMMWEMFGWERPVYVHLPLLLNPNGKGKLSKRKEAFDQAGQKILVLAHEYREAGYLPEAMMNFLINIGWNFGDDQEVFTVEEAIERFQIEEINPSNSAFPIEKLDWLNGTYIREMDTDELANRLRPFLEDADLTVDMDVLRQVTPIIQTRIKLLTDVVDMAGFFFEDWSKFVPPDADLLIQRKMDADGTLRLLEDSIETINKLDAFDHQTQYEAFKARAKELGVKNGQLFGTLRVAVTAQKISPPTFETMEILGEDESLRRLHLAIDVLR